MNVSTEDWNNTYKLAPYSAFLHVHDLDRRSVLVNAVQQINQGSVDPQIDILYNESTVYGSDEANFLLYLISKLGIKNVSHLVDDDRIISSYLGREVMFRKAFYSDGSLYPKGAFDADHLVYSKFHKILHQAMEITDVASFWMQVDAFASNFYHTPFYNDIVIETMKFNRTISKGSSIYRRILGKNKTLSYPYVEEAVVIGSVICQDVKKLAEDAVAANDMEFLQSMATIGIDCGMLHKDDDRSIEWPLVLGVHINNFDYYMKLAWEHSSSYTDAMKYIKLAGTRGDNRMIRICLALFIIFRGIFKSIRPLKIDEAFFNDFLKANAWIIRVFCCLVLLGIVIMGRIRHTVHAYGLTHDKND